MVTDSLVLFTNNETRCTEKSEYEEGKNLYFVDANSTSSSEAFDYKLFFEDVQDLNCTCTTEDMFDECQEDCKVLASDSSGRLCFPRELNRMKTFWMYLGIRLIVTLGIGMVNGLFDSSSMVVMKKVNADVGLQRLWATLGMCIFAPVSGYLADTESEHNFNHNYSMCFFLYGGLYGTAAFVLLFVDLSGKQPSKETFRNLLKLLMDPEVMALFFFVSFLGICWGFLENFLFLFLENELGAETLLMGLTVTVGSATGIPMAIISTWVSDKIGYVNILVIAYFAYTIRFLGYSFARDPYLCLVYETMENFTVTLLTIGVTKYCSYLAPLKMLTTMMTIWNSLHFITGRSLGSLSGGFLTDRIGSRRTFRVFAYSCAILGAIYGVLNFFYLRRKPMKERRQESLREMGADETDKDEELRFRATSICSTVVNFSESAGMYRCALDVESKTTAAVIDRRHSSASVRQRSRSMDVQSNSVRYSRSFGAEADAKEPSITTVSSTIPPDKEDIYGANNYPLKNSSLKIPQVVVTYNHDLPTYEESIEETCITAL